MKRRFLFLAALFTATVMNLHATYFIAGNGSATNNWCCGIDWQADGCAMNAGAYSTKVPAGTYEFKVTEGDWNVSYGYSSVDASASTSGYEGSNNVKFTVAAEANINVTFDGMYIVLTSDVPFGSVTVTSWTIAGDQAMMGSHWDPADTNNDMSLEGGVYKLVKKAFLTEGGFDYKACANHKLGVKEVPSSDNQTLQIDDDGDYEITFTLDAAGTTLSAVAKPDVPANITLNFDMQGHGTPVDPQTIASGSKFKKPNDPQAVGYDFRGWYSNAKGLGEAFDFNKTVTADNDTTITIYAKWRDPVAWEQFKKDLDAYSYVEYDSTYTVGFMIHLATTQDAQVQDIAVFIEASEEVLANYDFGSFVYQLTKEYPTMNDELRKCAGVKSPSTLIAAYTQLPYRMDGLNAVCGLYSAYVDLVYKAWAETNYENDAEICKCMLSSDQFFKGTARIMEAFDASEK